ncbi:hypothetical protein MRX96_016193 [Rhipicephalus microplus]
MVMQARAAVLPARPRSKNRDGKEADQYWEAAHRRAGQGAIAPHPVTKTTLTTGEQAPKDAGGGGGSTRSNCLKEKGPRPTSGRGYKSTAAPLKLIGETQNFLPGFPRSITTGHVVSGEKWDASPSHSHRRWASHDEASDHRVPAILRAPCIISRSDLQGAPLSTLNSTRVEKWEAEIV